MDIALLILIIGVLFNVFVAGLVSLKRQDSSARALGLVAVGLIIWEVSNHLADTDGSRSLFWNMLTFLGPMLVVVPSYYFVKSVKEQVVSKKTSLFIASGTILISLLCFTPLVVKGVVPRIVENLGVGYNPVYGKLYPLYIFWLCILIILHVINILPSSKEADKRFGQQMHLVRLATFAAVLIPTITNLVLPNIMKNSSSSKFVPLMSIVYMGPLSVAILKHKMLDIRTFVVRAAAYTLTTLILGLSYIAPLMFIVMKVMGFDFQPAKFVVSVFLSLIVATNYQRLKGWFDRVSSRMFFRDAYEPAEMITDLNRQLVGVIDINRMLNLTSEILHNYLNPEFCYFVLSPTNESGSYRIVANKNKKNIDSVDLVLRLARSHSHKKVIFIQQIDSQSNLAKEMSSQDIQALSELTPSNAKDPVGYMVIGIRKSGKAYDLTDSQVIESVSNTLIIAMQNALHFEEIQQFNATLQAQVEEQTRKYRMANEKLKKLDETKDEFISMASHQLRTPLTSVKGYLSMVLEGDVGKLNPQQEQLLKQSFLSSQRMVNLIADLLNLSRLNTGKFVIDAQPTDLTAVVEAELAQLHESAKAKNIELTYVRPETFPTIQLDENKIHQVVMNFIDNAIYYTPEGGQITVTLEETKSSVEFRVKDTGIGVPRALQRHLFVKFYRADNARRMRPDGTGLGIYMAKKVVLAQGGSIIFESQEGKGSTFGFRFGKKSHTLVKDGAVIT